jgi:hypothetical protein
MLKQVLLCSKEELGFVVLDGDLKFEGSLEV